eukprot:COSAG02_NODE_433_length_22435_cov_151.224078_13_plen_330_part_00
MHAPLIWMLLFGATGLGDAAQVVVFGDSWATGARTAFTDMFANHGANVTVDNRGVGGTFAQTWALTPNALRDAVTANPDATHVWLSLGGNDGIARLAIGQRPVSDIVDVTVGFLRMSLDPLFEMHPHIQLLVFGYEIIDLGGLLCGLMGLALMPECEGSARCMNGGPGLAFPGTYALQQAADTLAAIYPNNVVSLDLRGAMQEASGTVAPPFPNVDEFTPTTMMGDCIHPNYSGYSALLERSWHAYWRHFFPANQASRLPRNSTSEIVAMTSSTTVVAEQVMDKGWRRWLPAFDEEAYRLQAHTLGISEQKVEAVIAWHKHDYNDSIAV